ncbi:MULTISPECIES: phage major capsid protein [Bacteria]|uniref:phage major capsid protein n=1 Tax=Bacteria TaxID=2 RepID=UPI000E51ADE8|nr:phage major capsid protein [Fusobacterium ulcerans]RGY66047.1 phage major capsid protein [Fusobacterium ulcerans]DAO65985.1 MAG TPA: major capsid protein [Caudoviricetes sp.]DAU81115.1 MAG TPA: major capsid protein [Caudoviricetes sp.]
MNINELREKRAKAWETTKSFLESHRTDKGTITAEDENTYNNMMADIDGLGKEIKRLEKQELLDKELAKAVNVPITGKPGFGGQEEKLKPVRARNGYAKDLIKAMRSNFKQVTNLLQEGVDADGGYLVPEEYDKRIIDTLEEENIMRKLGTKITTSGQHKINIAAAKPAAAWIEEGGALTFGDAKFAQTLLDAHKLHVAIKITEELLYDNAFNLEGYIIDQFGRAMANAEEDAFLNGDGTGKPLGLFAESGGGTVAQTLTAAIKSDDVLDLIYALKRPYRKNAKFIMNDRTLLSLRKLKDNNGNYMWQPSYQAGEPDKLLGYSIFTSAYAPAAAIAFGDMSYYNIGDRGTRSIAELRELFAGNGMIAYVAKERVDGKLVLGEAVQIMQLNA